MPYAVTLSGAIEMLSQKHSVFATSQSERKQITFRSLKFCLATNFSAYFFVCGEEESWKFPKQLFEGRHVSPKKPKETFKEDVWGGFCSDNKTRDLKTLHFSGVFLWQDFFLSHLRVSLKCILV